MASKLYRINDGDWQDYKKPVKVTENCDITLMAVDAAGNDTMSTHMTGIIDKTIAASEPDDRANDVLWTKKDD